MGGWSCWSGCAGATSRPPTCGSKSSRTTRSATCSPRRATSVTATGTPASRLYLERSGDHLALDAADHRERHRLGRHAALRAVRRRPARPRVAVRGGELRRDGRTGGGPLVRAPAGSPRGRPGDGRRRCASTTSPCPTTSWRSSSTTISSPGLVPDPSATNPVVVNGHPITEATVVGPNDVVQFGATAVALRVFSRSLRQRARPTRPGAVPAHAVQAGHRPGAGVQADRQRARRSRSRGGSR